jgi:N utilization substance protein A
MSVKLSADDMRHIALFESITGASVVDCLADEKGKKITFIVRPGDIGLAIGKGGSRIKRVKHTMGKSIDVIEYSENPVEFVKNILLPAKVVGVNVIEREGRKVALVDVDSSDRGLAIGRGGQNIQRAKLLALRHHNIHDVSLT